MTVKGSCHCGKVAFEIAGEIPEKLTACTCSFCSKRGMLYAYYPRGIRSVQVYLAADLDPARSALLLVPSAQLGGDSCVGRLGVDQLVVLSLR